LGHDPDVVVSDQELDGLADVGSTKSDVPEPAQVADGDVAGLAHPVRADPELGAGQVGGRSGLEPGAKRDQRASAAEGGGAARCCSSAKSPCSNAPLQRGLFMLVSTNMNIPTARHPRPYRMGARAEAAAETGRRILRAVLDLHTERFHDQITLEAVAERAGVTVQTVLRRFGSREGLISAAGHYAETEVLQQRGAAPIGDITGAVDNLVDHYEEWGRSALRLLAQVERVPQLRAIAARGREGHYAWVDRTFEPYLAGVSERLLRAKLITLTDVYVWKLLRLDLGLDRTETASVLRDMVTAVVREGRNA
jgi:AcrR family transcriptional regulator